MPYRHPFAIRTSGRQTDAAIFRSPLLGSSWQILRAMAENVRNHDVLIVGAGPAGMAVAIAAVKAGLDYLILEKGSLVNSIYHFPRNMVFFTTPELLEIGGLPFTTPYEKPTRAEALRYYRRVADLYSLKIEFDARVVSVRRQQVPEAQASFRLETCGAASAGRTYCSRAVVFATGYFDNPNLLSVPGEDLPQVSHYYTESHGFYRKRVIVVGGNNSAAEAALELYRSGAHVTLVHRRGHLGDSLKYWVRPDIKNRIREGSVEALFKTRIIEIRRTSVVVDHDGKTVEIPAEAVFLMTGYHPDTDLLRGAGIEVAEDSCVPRYDPETLESNVPGIYLAGAVVSGRENNRVFIENGRLHGEVVIKHVVEKLRLKDSGNADPPGRH
jgi:thioredoxin reductase (NADPH)